VGDFGVKFDGLSDYQHLLDSLKELYNITEEPVGTRFLGFGIDYDEPASVLTPSLPLPGYMRKLLAIVCPDGIKFADSTSIYESPIFGSTAPQTSFVGSSELAAPARKRLLRKVVGSILCYARAVDSLVLTAVCELSCLQSAPNALTMEKNASCVGLCRQISKCLCSYRSL
jgi:hypothetical protein